MKRSSPTRAPLALAIWAGLSLGIALFLAPRLETHDFRIYWESTRRFVNGANPYELPHHSTFLSEVSAESPALKVWGPPIVFPVLAAFAALPWSSAEPAYLWAALFSFLPVLGRMVGLWSAPGRVAYLAAVVATLPLFLYGLVWGFISWIPLLALVYGLALFREKRFLASGSCFFFAAAKAQCVVVPAGLMALHGILGRERRFLAGLLIAALALVALVAVFQPHAFRDYAELDWSVVTAYSQVTHTLQSYGRLLGEQSQPAVQALRVLMVVLLGYLLLDLGSERGMLRLVAVCLPTVLFFGPYAWYHDYWIAAPSVVYLIGFSLADARLRPGGPSRTIARASLLLFAGSSWSAFLLPMSSPASNLWKVASVATICTGVCLVAALDLRAQRMRGADA